jgi:hypothetical protein
MQNVLLACSLKGIINYQGYEYEILYKDNRLQIFLQNRYKLLFISKQF